MDAPTTFTQFTAEILVLYRATRAPKTADRMAFTLRLCDRVLSPATPADLTPEALARFAMAAGETRHPNTVATLLSYLRRALSYAATRRLVECSPFAAWPGFVRFVPTRGPAIHAPARIGKVLADLRARASGSAEDARLHAWACVLAHTGLRRDEALFLRDEDLDLDSRVLEVRRRLKRPTARRVVPMTADLAAVLAGWLPRRAAGGNGWLFPNSRGKPWSGGAPGYRPIDRLRDAGEASGVKGFTPSSLRHSFATAAATVWNVPPATLQRWMGHTDIRTTMKYYVHLDLAALHAAARSIAFPAA